MKNEPAACKVALILSPENTVDEEAEVKHSGWTCSSLCIVCDDN